MNNPNNHTVTDLYARIHQGGDFIDGNHDRTIREFYPLGDPDPTGYIQAAELTITHDKEQKRYRAEVCLSAIKTNDGWFTQSFVIGEPRVVDRFLTEHTNRYSRAKLDDFAVRARDMIALIGAGL